MSQTVEFFYDFRSPYSYLAFTQLRGMDVAISFKPMKVLKVMEKVGNTPTTLTCAAKGVYARTDLGRWALRYGIALNPSDMRTNDGDAMSRAVLAAPQALKADVTLALYRAIWSNGTSLATSAAVIAELAAAKIDTTEIADRIDTAETADLLDANSDEAAARGVFGSPTILVGDAMFFGNDRLDFLREELTRLERAA